MITRVGFHALAICVSASPLLSAPVHAQASNSADQLQEIIVTAERREQSVLTVPASIQATTGAQLNDIGIYNLTDLQIITPGYLPSTASGYTQVYLRGIGNDIFVGADPSVATFVDDVPRIWGTMNENFVDVERVEVLKGAQGGLYGRNATGGVINIVTVKPDTEKFSGNAIVDYGELNTLRAAGFVNVPLNDHVAFTLSIERDSHDPYVRNNPNPAPYTAAMFPTGSFLGSPQATASTLNSYVHPPSGVANQDFWATDDKLLLKFSDTFKITLAGDYNYKFDTNGTGNVNLTPALTQGALSEYLGLFGFNPHLPPGLDQATHSKYSSSMGLTPFVDTWDYGGSVTAIWNAPGIDITSISAARGQSTSFGSESSFATVPDVNYTVFTHHDFQYQEFRGVSTMEGPFHWLGGATYLKNSFDDRTTAFFFGGLAPAGAPLHSTDDVHNWSVYAQASYDIIQDLDLTVSGRYVHETNNALFTLPVVSGSNSVETKFLPSATLSYRLDDGNIYARFARGFKAGGINPSAAPIYFPPGAEGSVFGPEQVDTYEVGYRKSLFDRKVQLTSALFYNNYTGVQVSDHANAAYAATVILAIVNGGTARTWGAEESLSWRVTNPVTVGVTAGYLNAKYKDFSLTDNPVLADFNLSGQTMINSPEWQFAFTSNLDQPLTNRLRLVGNIVTSFVSDVVYAYSAEPGVVPNADGPSYWLTNLRIGVRTMDDKYGFSIFANNIFDRSYYTFGTSAATGMFLTWGNPRIVGGEVTVKF